MADTFIDDLDWLPDELITSTKLNQWWANMQNFHNGTALGDGIIVTRHYNDGSVTADKLGVHTDAGILAVNTIGNKTVSGLAFKPRIVLFLPLFSDSSSAFQFGLGYMTASSQGAYGGGSNTSGNAGRAGRSNKCIIVTDSTGSIFVEAERVSLNSDGFTINMIQSPDTNTHVFWMAFA